MVDGLDISYDLKTDLEKNKSALEKMRWEYCRRTYIYLEENRHLLQGDERYKRIYDISLKCLIEGEMKSLQGLTWEQWVEFNVAYAALKNREKRDNFVLTPEIEDFILDE